VGDVLVGRAYDARFGYDGYSRQKFTGKERDAETGLDWFGARYFSGAQGRFTSPDKPFVDQYHDGLQSWNLYAYGRNNPLKYVDQDGEAAWLVGAAVGAIMDVGVQTLIEGKSIRDIDVGTVLISAGAGAVGGGLAAKAGRLAPFAKHLLEGAFDAAGSVAQQVYQKGDVSLTETAIDVAGGRVIGAVAGGVADRAAKNSPDVKQLLKEADRKSRVAANAAEAGNPSSSARRSAQAATLNNQAADRVASRSTAASTAASQATSAAAKRAVAEAKKREEEREDPCPSLKVWPLNAPLTGGASCGLLWVSCA
jgi:RHS repeat-associated protein